MLADALPPPGFWLHALATHPAALSSPSPTTRPLPLLLSSASPVLDASIPDLSVIPPLSHLPLDDENDLDLSILSLNPSYRSAPAPTTPPRRNSRYALLALHEGLAILCLNTGQQQPTLRLLNLRAWKGLLDESQDDLDAALAAADYKELRLRGNVGAFHVKQIELNATGRHMAVVGEHEVVIVVLPRVVWGGENACEVIDVACWSLELGKVGVQVVRALWHPLGESCVHLMVLGVDGSIGMHNVTAGKLSLEKTYSFLPTTPPTDDDPTTSNTTFSTNRAGMFGPDLDQDTFVSFCTAPNDGKWGAMTVYGVTRSGDVYSLCPVLPRKSVFTPGELNALRIDNLAFRAGSQGAGGPYSQTQAYWRTTMIDELLTAAKSAPDTLPGEPVSLFLPRTANALKTKPRGPYLFQPAADVGVDLDSACGIVALRGEGGVDVVVLAFASGVVRVGVDVEGAAPAWCIEKQPTPKEAALPLFLVVEDIDLALGDADERHRFTALSADPRYPHVVYCYHDQGVHCINTGPVLRGFEALAAPGHDDASVPPRLDEEAEGAARSEVNLLISTGGSETAGVDGFAIITEPSLGYSYLLVTAHPQLSGDVLSVPIRRSRPTPSTATKTTAACGYTPVLCAPLYQPPAIMRKPAPTPKAELAGDVAIGEIETAAPLLAFFEHVKERRSDLLERHFAVLDLERRLTHQQVELQKQQSLTTLWSNLLATQSTAHLSTRIETAHVQAYLLRKRLGIVLQILMDEARPLSKAEVRWVQELEGLGRAFRERMLPFVEKIESRMEHLHAEQALLEKKREAEYAAAAAGISDLGESQRRRIETVLKQEYALLVAATQKVVRVKEMARKVEAGRVLG